MSDEQLELFSVQQPRRPPKLAARPEVRRFAKYRPLRRTLCDDCVAAIHERGQGNAPLPKTVRWRRLVAATWQQLCDAHKQQREAGEQ
jgi:hypothetical protein